MDDIVIYGAIAGIAAVILVFYLMQGKQKSIFSRISKRSPPQMGRYREILSTAEKIAYEKKYSKATQFVYKSFAELAREKMGIIWTANMTAEEFVESMVSRDAMLNIHDLMGLTAVFERARYGKGEITPTEYNKGITAFKNVYQQMYLEGSRRLITSQKGKMAKGYTGPSNRIKSKLNSLTSIEDMKK